MNTVPTCKSLTLSEMANICNNPVILKHKKTRMYKFIKDHEIPEDQYFSIVCDAKSSITSTNKKAIDICYKIVKSMNYVDYFRHRLNKEDLKFYYIKERFTLDSDRLNSFIDLLHSEYGFSSEFSPDKLIGTIELYDIGYNDNTSFGYIYGRVKWTHEIILDYARYLDYREAGYVS